MSARKVIPIGTEFGRWKVVGEAVVDKRPSGRNYIYFPCKCKCDAGIERLILGNSLGRTSFSCGCLNREIARERNTTHGGTHTRLYRIWIAMKTRCTNPNTKAYSRYMGRGIEVPDEWLTNFAAFREWAVNNGYEDDLSINRVDNDGSYGQDNCEWSDDIIQASNRSNNHHLTAWGETKVMSEWVRDDRCIVCYSTLNSRIHKGWDAEVAMTKSQSKMFRSTNNYVTAFGETKPMIEWSRHPLCSVTYQLLHYRIKTGWDPENAITTPSARSQ